MEVLYLLESIRTPFLDKLFSLLTHLGSEVAFLVMAVAVYWCCHKGRGVYLLTVGCLGTTLCQFLKLACRVPRPWVKDPNFTIVESARADAGDFSFPSGHTQNAVGTYGSMAMDTKARWGKAIWILLAVITAFSRLYLGVHTLQDVLVSAVLTTVLVVALHPLFRNWEEHPHWGIWILLGILALNALFLAYVSFWPFPADVDAGNLQTGRENVVKLFGAVAGMLVGYTLDVKLIHADTKAPLPGQIMKVVLGLGILLVLKEGLKPVLGDSLLGDGIRYGMLTVFAGGIWPMTFGLFRKVGKR